MEGLLSSIKMATHINLYACLCNAFFIVLNFENTFWWAGLRQPTDILKTSTSVQSLNILIRTDYGSSFFRRLWSIFG
jgi:hypothetical protein